VALSDRDADTGVTLASYNVHGCIGVDGRHDVPRIARVLKELRAQVIALQEVIFHSTDAGTAEPVDILAELSGFHAICAPVARGQDTHYGNALLTTLPVLRVETLNLNFQGYEPRTALDVDLDAHGRRLRVIATHLGLRPAERRYQVRKLLAHVAYDVEAGEPDQDAVTVLLGDFNEWFLMGRPLRWLHDRFGRSASHATYPSSWPLLALDRVWVHPKGMLERVWCHVGGEARVASDHLPLVATLRG
jgi:endonuclease/exonuclease/phosphatase family metal-dependent hydrolase